MHNEVTTRGSLLASARRRFGARPLTVFLVTILVYAFSPATQNVDSFLALPTAWELVHHLSLHLDSLKVPAVTTNYALAHARGHLVDSFPWADSLWLVPGVLLFDVGHLLHLTPSVHSMIAGDHTVWMDIIQLSCASLVTALAVLAVWHLAYGRLSGDEVRRRRLATLVALGFAFGTSAWSTASRAMWEHGPSMLTQATALVLADRLVSHRASRPKLESAALGATLAAAYAFRPTNVIPVVVITVWFSLAQRRRLGWELLGGASVGILWLIGNVAAYGHLLPSYNQADRLSLYRGYGLALAADIISPSRGILVYSPILLLAVLGFILGRKNEGKWLDIAIVIWVVGGLAVMAALRDPWWAGHAYGPRFGSEVVVPLVALSVVAVDRLGRISIQQTSRAARLALGVTLVATGWSVVVNSQGALSRVAWCWNVDPVNVNSKPSRVWNWADPQFARPIERLVDTGSVVNTIFGHCHDRTP